MDHKDPAFEQPLSLVNESVGVPITGCNHDSSTGGATSGTNRDGDSFGHDIVSDDVQQMLYGLLPVAGVPELPNESPRISGSRDIAYLRDARSYNHLPSLVCSDNLSAVVTGDSAEVLRYIPESSIQSCITSPPYWSLRDYGITGQIGLEHRVSEYISNLVVIFDRVRRALRDDGTLWLNIGDSYTSGGRTWRAPDKKNPVRAMDVRPATPEGLKPKDLIGVPWRLAFALQDAGWYLRADIIWNKPNCQPESVRDRPTRSHEYLFLFSKSEKYYYNPEGYRGPNDRNIRTVWDIKTKAYKEAHFATFPPALIGSMHQTLRKSRPG